MFYCVAASLLEQRVPELLGAEAGAQLPGGGLICSVVLQQVYWNNGFLSYWELKQVPNFLVVDSYVLLCVAPSLLEQWVPELLGAEAGARLPGGGLICSIVLQQVYWKNGFLSY